MHLLHCIAHTKLLPWLAQTKAIPSKTQLSYVNGCLSNQTIMFSEKRLCSMLRDVNLETNPELQRVPTKLLSCE